jgi:hypothetical protein
MAKLVEPSSPITVVRRSGEQKEIHVPRGTDYYGVVNVLIRVAGRPEPAASEPRERDTNNA